MYIANAQHAAELIQEGYVVALPTETVYGLAANALSAQAVSKIFEIKNRPAFNPLIVHVHSLEQAEELAYIGSFAKKIAKHFWPGALTLILPKKDCVPYSVTANKETVALRLPSHPIFREVIRLCGLPLAAPSANPSSYISPTKAEHVRDSLGEKLPYILDGGPCKLGLESTILDISDPKKPRLLRPGPVSKEALETFLGAKIAMPKQWHSEKEGSKLTAPGSLKKHYSPKTSLTLFDQTPDIQKPSSNIAIVWMGKGTDTNTQDLPTQAAQYFLSQTNSLDQAAASIFDTLRELDSQDYERIYFQRAPAQGIGIAINDRLNRAACQDT